MDKKQYIENNRERLLAPAASSVYTRQSDEEMDVETEYIPPFSASHELPRTPRRPTRLPPIPPTTTTTTTTIPTVTVNLNDLEPPPSPPPLTFPPDSDDDF